MKRKGLFVISLDFECVWGVFDNVDYKKKIPYFQNTLYSIPKILKLFRDEEIHATWATVGMLFNNNWKEWNNNVPNKIPNYFNTDLNAYDFGKSIQHKNTEKICFAPHLIQQIKNTPFQEIGTHTYSHYYCLEEGQYIEDFREDLQQSILLAKRNGIQLRSLVFPRNQIKNEYLKICFELGITSVRSNPKSWYWKNPNSNSLLTKLVRTGDAYLPLGNKSYDINPSSKKKNLPHLQMASRFLRPVESNFLLRKLKLNRIKKEMTWAAKNNKVYHLWWHPHNFGDRPKESIKDLTNIIIHYKFLKMKYDFTSVNMHEFNIKLDS